MPNKSPIMNLSRDEELFLHRWIYDEAHYEQGPGPAKRLQVEHRAVPAELADLIAASIPDPADQESMAHAPPSAEPPCWPWSEETFRARVVEARAMLESRRQAGPGKVQTRSQA